MKISLIIPCYNEEEGIPSLARQLEPVWKELQQHHEPELILVDDGSTDKTNSLLHQYFPYGMVVRHIHNKNLGSALKTGFAHAHGEYIACLDSDCTYDPALLLDMIKMLDEKTDIITVSSYHPDGKVSNVPAYRLFLSRCASQLYRTLLSSHIYDYTSLVRVYKRHVIQSVHFHADDFLSVAELLARAILKGYTVKELPAELKSRVYGVSKMKTLRTIRSHAGLMVRIASHRLLRTKL